jgi:hypothetical protein
MVIYLFIAQLRELSTHHLIGTSNVVTMFLTQVATLGDLICGTTMIHTHLITFHVLWF